MTHSYGRKSRVWIYLNVFSAFCTSVTRLLAIKSDVVIRVAIVFTTSMPPKVNHLYCEYGESVLMCWLYQPLPRKDGRRWTTVEQEAWLNSHLPSYLEAAAGQRYDKFWPGLFQEWFEQFKEPDPDSDMPTDSEPDEESDNAPPSDNDLPSNKPTLKKRKRHGRSKRASKKQKVGMFFWDSCQPAAHMYCV